MLDELEDPTQELEPVMADGSLRERMRARHEALSKIKTERFPIPGFEDLLEVELRITGMRAVGKIAKRNERVRDEGIKQLYLMADLLLEATVGFWRIEGENRRPLTERWVELAQMVPNCPDSPTPRQALILLVAEHKVPMLYTQFEQWLTEAKPEVDEEVGADFARTG